MQIFYTGLHPLVFQYLKLTSSRYRTSPEWVRQCSERSIGSKLLLPLFILILSFRAFSNYNSVAMSVVTS